MIVAQAAPASTTLTSPNRVLSWWWSTLTVLDARARTSSGQATRAPDPQSTASSVNGSVKLVVTAVSVPTSQRYSRGTGASAITASTALPAARNPRSAPISEPSASPSGFSCVTTTIRSAAASAAAAAA